MESITLETRVAGRLLEDNRVKNRRLRPSGIVGRAAHRRKGRPDGTAPPETDRIEGLRAVAEFLDGSFPPTLEFQGLLDACKAQLETKSPSPAEQEMKALNEKSGRAFQYLQALELQWGARDLRYVGGRTKLRDSHSPVLWWQPKGADTYRVVYADLNVRDVAPEDLPSPE